VSFGILPGELKGKRREKEAEMVQIPNAPRLGDMPSGDPVPEAVYHVRCDKAEYKVAKGEKKTPMAAVQFTIFGPEEAEQYHGRKLFENLMLSGEGMFRTRQLLEAAGNDEDFVLTDTDQLVGIECQAVVQMEKERKNPETGETYAARNRIARFQPIEG
jgi:hypothetical protein